MNTYPARLGLQQRVLPDYRVPFFDLLAERCEGGLGLFAGQARAGEMITGGAPRISKFRQARNVHLFGGAFYLCYQAGFIDWLKGWDPQALIVEANPRYPATASAVEWMHARRRRVLGWGLGAAGGRGFRRGRRLAFLKQFDGLLAYSQRGADEYAALGFPRPKIFVAHNSVSPAPARPPERARRAIERAAILFVGRFQPRKRVDHLIRACARLEPKPRLILAGDGPERAALQSLARELYPAAEFIGAKHGTELEQYFREADLFVLPGTGGLAVQEAMSYGLPVIVAKGDGTQDDLVREGNGWQITPEDDEALVSTMKQALSDIPRLRKMGRESFRIASEEINIQKMAEVFVQALNAL